MLKSLDAIGTNLANTNRHVNRSLTKFLKKYNVTPEQWTVLKQLEKEKKVSQKELSRITDKDQATLTKILDLLEKKRLVQRKLNQEDRRSFLIQRTEEGKRLVEKINPKIETFYREQIFNEISWEELIYLNKIFTHIQKNMK